LLVILASLFLCAAALYATAWYHRIQAEHLLAAVKKLKVGVTTQAEYDQVVGPFVTDANLIQGENGRPISEAYAVTPVPSWVWNALGHMPAPIASALSNWAVLRWTLFEVGPTFKQGTLTDLTVTEMHGEGHPYAGRVRIHAGVVQQLLPYDERPFSGYSAHQGGGDGRVLYTEVDMDERATPEERRRALDFQFHCFTAFRPCSDGRQLLNPVVTDPAP
jgi:hypothetical protein